MPVSLEALYQAALALPDDQRAELANRLLDTLPPEVPSQLHPAWKAELQRRSAQIDSGEATPLTWDEVRRLAWETVEQDEAARDG